MEAFDIKPVFLNTEKCNGCVSCMKRCPTEAIRVRDGKATIEYARCVGCGECVKVCPTKAKKEYYDKFETVKKYRYTVAVPSPSVYGQFNNLHDVNYVLTGLKKLGFDAVYEVAAAAEEVSFATRDYLKKAAKKPVIGSACPAITNLITMRYEHLIPHLSPLLQPEIVAAWHARKQAEENSGFKKEEIGVFVVTQCAANVMELKRSPDGDCIDGVLSFSELYVPLLGEMNKLPSSGVEPLSRCGRLGVSWGCSSGEAVGLGTDNYLAADGIENVMTVLNDLEHEKLNNLEFLELYACTSGCVGGSMNVENPFLARTRLRLLRKALPPPENREIAFEPYVRSAPYEPNNVYKLADNRSEAMRRMMAVKKLYESLPQLNCGACGAPNCMAFAEDVVKGLNVKCKYARAEKEGENDRP